MTELSKLVSSLVLVGAGFFAASLFGPPDLVERLTQRFRPASGQSTSWLEPIATAPPSGPPLRDPSRSVSPLPPLPQTTPSVPAIAVSQSDPFVAPGPAPAALASAQASVPQAPVASVPAASAPAASGANDWFNQANPWPTEPSTAVTPATAPVAAWPSQPASPEVPRAFAPQPLSPAPLSPAPASPAPWPTTERAAASHPAPNNPALNNPAQANPWGEPWPTEPVAPPANPFAVAKPVTRDLAPPVASPPPQRPSVRAQPSAPQRLSTHIVTDGDTLPALAERYLGTPDRADELYRLNEDRLDAPGLLPIGVVLRVPDEPRAKRATLYPTPPQQRLVAPPSGRVSPPVAAAPRQSANQFAPIGYTDGPALGQSLSPSLRPSLRQSRGLAPVEHKASRLVPVGDPAEAAAPLPTIRQDSGAEYVPRTIDELQW
ncbi:MAG: LysM peptidoglycan-binding domain-containing protein [Planctomycetota bacterium]